MVVVVTDPKRRNTLYGRKHGRYPVKPMDPFSHGEDRGARAHWRRGETPCEACMKAHRRKKEDMRAKARATGLAPGDKRHGTYGYRTYGCRCAVCVEQGRAQQRDWYQRERSRRAKS